MLITLERLQYLALVVETGSFSAAARQLGCTAWTVNQVLQNMETDLGKPLFERHPGKPPIPTVFAKSLYFQALEVMPRIEAMEAKASSIQQGVEDEVSFVVHPMVLYPKIASLLAQLPAKFENTNVRLIESEEYDLIGEDIDVGIVPNLMSLHRGKEWLQIDNIEWVCLVATTHPLSKKRGELDQTDLGRYHQLLYKPRQSGHEMIHDSLNASSKQIICERFFQYREMLLAGAGFAWMPKQLATDWIASKRLVALKLSYHQSAMFWGIDMIWGANIGPAAQWLVDSIRSS
ncbi:LysR family transcriptional regulator [Paraferrimonas sedimenticola]|uniref:Transcriptional regulator n=1 Tax=Paraferrimonas sedimenticola TaxID=375674 RepID=A0AA37RTI7_9GAMM|nr:LysR family transcriptional regulator [Paraferrimonas sedimenticola]GLP95356.1 transcriptional regulator [Paraferrimonas sedimenticola]